MQFNVPFVTKIVIALFLVIAGYTFFLIVSQGYQGVRSKHWPQTKGNVLTSETIQSRSLAYGQRLGNQEIKLNFPKIFYKYNVNGKEYISNKVQFGMLFNQKGVLKNFPSGKVVTVTYNPDNPAIAVLKTGVDWMGIIYTIALVLFFICVAGLFLASSTLQ